MSSPRITHQLSARSLRVGYLANKSEITVLDGLDLKINAGEFICLLGPNGSGKSTLLRTLAGAQQPLGGTLDLECKPFSEINPRERARAISIVFTDTFPNGLMDVYAFTALGRHPYSGWFGGLTPEDHQSIQHALVAAGASHLKDRQVTELSDGERQKTAIARALAQESRLMLLDEPTAFLDLPGRIELMRMLRDLSREKGIGMLLSTHDLDLALRFADRLWLISPNNTLIQGFPESLAFSGSLGDAFASDHLDWDNEAGSFRPHRDPQHACSIQGTGAAALWTRRSLERNGFAIRNHSEDTAFTIEISNNTGSLIWHVHTSSQQNQTFHSFDALITWLSGDWQTDLNS